MRKTSPLRIIAGVLLALTLLFAFFAPQLEVFYGGGGWTPMLIGFGAVALAGFTLLTLGVFMRKRALMITGSSVMLAIAVASAVFCVIGLATGGESYSYYSSYSNRYRYYSYFRDNFYGFSMFSAFCALVAWLLVFIAMLKKRGGRVLTFIATGLFLLALGFLVCACVDTSWYGDATLFVVFRWIYYILLFQALIMLGIAMPDVKAKKVQPVESPVRRPAPDQNWANEWQEPEYPQEAAPGQNWGSAWQPPVPEAQEIEDAVGQIEDAVEAEAQEAAEAFEEAPELVKAAAESAAEEAAGQAEEIAEDVTEAAADKIEEAADQIEDAAEELKKDLPE